jgi:hypothetical protein
VADTLVKAAPDAQLNDIKALLGRMMFTGKAVQKKARRAACTPPAGPLAAQPRAALRAGARSAPLQIHRKARCLCAGLRIIPAAYPSSSSPAVRAVHRCVFYPGLHLAVVLPQPQHARRHQASDGVQL